MRSMYNEDRAEIRTAQFLAEQLENHGFQSFQVGTYAPFLSCGDNKTPDIILLHEDCNIVFLVEVDEHAHSRYEETCEWFELYSHCQSIMATPTLNPNVVVCIRFNPDVWRVNGKHQHVNFDAKMEVLRETIMDIVEEEAETEHTFPIRVMYINYPTKDDNPVVVRRD